MRKIVLILAALALVPTMAVADDLSTNLSGGCQGFASLVTSGSTISYGIITDAGNPSGATVTGGGANINLQANFSAGSAAGTASADAGTIAAMNANPSAYTLTVTGVANCTGSLVNNGSGPTTPGTLEFSAAEYQKLENGGQMMITVTRSGGTSGAVSVDYATSDGTATEGTDYTAASGTLNWDDGDGSEMMFSVPLIDNGVEDGNLTVNLTLSNATGGAELGLTAATLTIVDDESLVCVADEDTLCLNVDDRFRAEITWTDFEGNTGVGETFDIGLRDSGLFYFFSEDNIEMLLKVLDACNLEGFNSFWVFYAATTNVAFELTITDTQTGAVQTYSNALGNAAAPVLDTAAFMTCP